MGCAKRNESIYIYDFENQANCSDCIKYHRNGKKLHGCHFFSQSEKTYNEAILHFRELYNAGII